MDKSLSSSGRCSCCRDMDEAGMQLLHCDKEHNALLIVFSASGELPVSVDTTVTDWKGKKVIFPCFGYWINYSHGCNQNF